MMTVVSLRVLILIDMEMVVNLYGARRRVLDDTAIRRKERLQLFNLGRRHLKGFRYHVPADPFATGWCREGASVSIDVGGIGRNQS